jgi:hypothetical protein
MPEISAISAPKSKIEQMFYGVAKAPKTWSEFQGKKALEWYDRIKFPKETSEEKKLADTTRQFIAAHQKAIGWTVTGLEATALVSAVVLGYRRMRQEGKVFTPQQGNELQSLQPVLQLHERSNVMVQGVAADGDTLQRVVIAEIPTVTLADMPENLRVLLKEYDPQALAEFLNAGAVWMQGQGTESFEVARALSALLTEQGQKSGTLGLDASMMTLCLQDVAEKYKNFARVGNVHTKTADAQPGLYMLLQQLGNFMVGNHPENVIEALRQAGKAVDKSGNPSFHLWNAFVGIPMDRAEYYNQAADMNAIVFDVWKALGFPSWKMLAIQAVKLPRLT